MAFKWSITINLILHITLQHIEKGQRSMVDMGGIKQNTAAHGYRAGGAATAHLIEWATHMPKAATGA